VHEIIGRLILLNRSHSPSHRILGFGQLDREDAPQAGCGVELFRIPKGFGCVERRQAGRGAGVHAPKPSSHSGRIVGKPLQQQNPSGVGHGSEGTWKSTLRFRRSSVKTVIMRSRVRLTMSGFLPPIAAFQRMEKRTAWIGNGIPHLRRDPRSSEIHAPDARTEPSHLTSG